MTHLSHNKCMKNINNILDSICERIEDIKTERGWTTKDFAEFVDIPRTTVNSWLLKKRIPKIDLLYKMADKLDITIDYLVGREE